MNPVDPLPMMQSDFGREPRPVCTESLNPDIVVMKAAKDRARFDASGPLNRARDRGIFFQSIGSHVFFTPVCCVHNS